MYLAICIIESALLVAHTSQNYIHCHPDHTQVQHNTHTHKGLKNLTILTQIPSGTANGCPVCLRCFDGCFSTRAGVFSKPKVIVGAQVQTASAGTHMPTGGTNKHSQLGWPHKPYTTPDPLLDTSYSLVHISLGGMGMLVNNNVTVGTSTLFIPPSIEFIHWSLGLPQVRSAYLHQHKL